MAHTESSPSFSHITSENSPESVDDGFALTPEMGYRPHIDSITERIDFDDAAIVAFQAKYRKIGAAAAAFDQLRRVSLPGIDNFEPTHY